MQLHNQPKDGAFGEKLIDLLNLSTGKFYGISAFAKNSGVLMIENALKTFKENGGIITFIVGIDLDGTSVEALKNLLRLSDNLYVVHSENNITFHPKIYSIQNNDKTFLAIGSNNLTKGGFFNNYEASLFEYSSEINESLLIQLSDLIEQYTNTDKETVIKIETDEDIFNLQKSGYINLEEDIHVKMISSHSKKNKDSNRIKIFGSEFFLSRGSKASTSSVGETKDVRISSENDDFTTDSVIEPSIIESSTHYPTNTEKTLYTSSINDIFWFETGSLTGGSRNILDLSKSGRLRNGSARDTIYYRDASRVKGGVTFFGLDPDTPLTKDITINYSGRNYRFATIKYAPANSNWRLQIKGSDVDEISITLALGNSMINKILLFEKVNDINYIMTILSLEKLQLLQDSSLFWATNGNTANGRKFGYILKELEE